MSLTEVSQCTLHCLKTVSRYQDIRNIGVWAPHSSVGRAGAHVRRPFAACHSLSVPPFPVKFFSCPIKINAQNPQKKYLKNAECEITGHLIPVPSFILVGVLLPLAFNSRLKHLRAHVQSPTDPKELHSVYLQRSKKKQVLTLC